MELEYSEKTGLSKKIIQFCIGILVGTATAFVTALILSLVMTLSFVPDSSVKIASMISTVFAAFVCGFTTVRLIGHKGLLYGALSGLLLFAVRSAISLILAGSTVFLNFLIAFFIDTAVAAIGGVTAVNVWK